MKVIKYPKKLELDSNDHKYTRDNRTCVIYLAGPMTNWRKSVTDHFKKNSTIVFIDPSVPNYEKLSEEELQKHREWEIETIGHKKRKCNIVVYWFDMKSPETIHLLDNKAFLRRLGNTDIIGMSINYPYKKSLEKRVSKYTDDFPDTINKLIKRIEIEHSDWYYKLD